MDLFMYISLGISGFSAFLLLLNMVLYLTGRAYVECEQGEFNPIPWVCVLLFPFLNVFVLCIATVFGLIAVLGRVGKNIRSRSISRRARKREKEAADLEHHRCVSSQQRYKALKVEDADRVVISEKKPSWEEIAALAGTKEE